ncbi:MAG TPA: SPW repeat protein [Chloroflexota bacterium]|nr:SPW repeat protein [Chloroflexota bacterium]
MRARVIFFSLLNVIAGVWLLTAPFALSYVPGSAPYANDLFVGAIVVTLALARVVGAYRSAWLSWITAAVGIWLILAPFVLNYTTSNARYNDIVLGVLITLFATISALSSPIQVNSERGGGL